MVSKASSKKAAAVMTPSTPKADSGDEVPATPATGVKPKTPRKKTTPKVFHHLPTGASGAAPVDVTYENDSVLATALPKGGGFGQALKLVAPQPFELVGSYLLDNGLQAIIIKPSAPFLFMKLPTEIRDTILRLNLAPSNDKGPMSKIDISDKAGIVKAKEFSKEFKHRTAMAFLNKELAAAARMIIYGFRFRFDNTTSLLNFLSQASDGVHKALCRITIVNYIKLTAMPAMAMLANCTNLTAVSIIGGVGINSKPEKAAKAFFTEAGQFLQAVVQANQGNKDAALSVVTFGRKCFTIKEEDELVTWDDELTQEFAEFIVMKLNALELPTWTCICGGAEVRGHDCGEVMALRARVETFRPLVHKRVAALSMMV